jgi:predicted RNA-binding Zn-ribbon protein involved in translation (DUF1610 family)
MPTLNSAQFSTGETVQRHPAHLKCPKCGEKSWNSAAAESHYEKWHAPHFELPQTLPKR